MDCPVDGTLLALSERQGVEIDYCPKCRGVWLDRGELDKLLERAGEYEDRARREPDRDDDRGRDSDRGRDFDRDRPREQQHYGGGQRKKKKSFLGEFFEFD